MASEPESKPEAETEPQAETEPEGESEGEPEWVSWPEPEMDDAISQLTPQAEFDSTEDLILWVMLFSVCMVLIIIGDVFIMTAIARSKNLRCKEANLYLLSLIAARTLVGVFVVPARITSSFSEKYLGTTLCQLCHFAALGSSTTTLMSVVGVAVVKYQEVMTQQKCDKNQLHSPQKPELSAQNSNEALKLPPSSRQHTLKRTYVKIALLWLVGHIYAIRAPFLYDLVELPDGDTTRWSCSLSPDKRFVNRWFVVVDFVCLFVLPMITIAFCYIKVIRALSGTDLLEIRLIKDSALSQDLEIHRHLKKQSVKTSRMLVVVMALFVVCNVPLFVLRIIGLAGGSVSVEIEGSIYLASYSNSWLNVLVCLAFRKDIRSAFMGMFCKCKKNKVIHVSPRDQDKDTAPKSDVLKLK